MKTWVKNLIGMMFIVIGFAAIVLGEIDDSPGLMLIGLIVMVVSIFTLVKKFVKRKKIVG